jgi:MFS superfamily sulfate permease-like transporter
VCDCAESIIVAKYYAGKHHYTVSPNRELVALGSANMVGSFFRIFPSFGSLVRSALGTCLIVNSVYC